jgi:hypothetical protein
VFGGNPLLTPSKLSENQKTIALLALCILPAFVGMLNATVWNYRGNWSNFDFEYHFRTIKMMQERGRYPLSHDREYGVGFYPPLSHTVVRLFILAIGHPSLTEIGSQARPWIEMFTLNSFVNALQVIPLFFIARRFTQSNIAGVLASLWIIANGFQTWPVMGPFPSLYGLVFLSFAILFIYEGSLGGRWTTQKYVLAGVFLVCAGFTHPLSYVFSIVFPFAILMGRLGYRAISRSRPILTPNDRTLLVLCLAALIIPGVSYYLRADPSGFIPHFSVNYAGVDVPFYTNPIKILINPWILTSLVVVGYSLWRRKAGGFLIGTWLLLPFILVEFYRFSPPHTLILGRYLTYGQPYFSLPQAILLGSGVAFLLQEATARFDFKTNRINLLRLPLLALLIAGGILAIGEFVKYPTVASVTASILKLQQGAYDISTISNVLVNLLYWGLGVSSCVAVEFFALRHSVSMLRRQPSSSPTAHSGIT